MAEPSSSATPTSASPPAAPSPVFEQFCESWFLRRRHTGSDQPRNGIGRAAFAGWKTAAWLDRSAPRDLYDLWALGRIGALDADAASLFAAHGPTHSAPRSWRFRSTPLEPEWQTQLAAQTRLEITAATALAEVRRGRAATLGTDW
jgi:hypothetical protein